MNQILLVSWEKISPKSQLFWDPAPRNGWVPVSTLLFCRRSFLKKSTFESDSSCFVGEIFSKSQLLNQILLVSWEKFSQKSFFLKTSAQEWGGPNYNFVFLIRKVRFKKVYEEGFFSTKTRFSRKFFELRIVWPWMLVRSKALIIADLLDTHNMFIRPTKNFLFASEVRWFHQNHTFSRIFNLKAGLLKSTRI